MGLARTAAVTPFDIPFRQTHLRGERWSWPEPRATALLLHGAGSASMAGFQDLRVSLGAFGIDTLAFDFVGHGLTGGDLLGTTLHDRVQQVQAVVASQPLDLSTLTLLGYSMGADAAMVAGSHLGVGRLGLIIPAAYAAAARRLPFGPAFSAVLRQPRSWEHSDAFAQARAFTGHLLVVSAACDEVIPPEVPRRYAQACRCRASTTHLSIDGAGHALSAHFTHRPAARHAMQAELARLCLRPDARPWRDGSPGPVAFQRV